MDILFKCFAFRHMVRKMELTPNKVDVLVCVKFIVARKEGFPATVKEVFDVLGKHGHFIEYRQLRRLISALLKDKLLAPHPFGLKRSRRLTVSTEGLILMKQIEERLARLELVKTV